MQRNSEYQTEESTVVGNITFLIGDKNTLDNIKNVEPKVPFDAEILDYLNDISKILLKDPEAKNYPDVVTLGFWMRKSSMLSLKERFLRTETGICCGKGTVFHIAPSNVPVNYAYSLVAGLCTGNANVIRIPSKGFPQVNIINRAIAIALEKYEGIRPYICLLRYGRDKVVNDYLSSIADMRVIWGGDSTIAEIRKSPLAPRAGEITFADRFSIAVLDSERYLDEEKERIAQHFYNDTYLSDQNACTSPRLVVWYGKRKDEAQEIFWNHLHRLVKEKYTFQPIQGVNKLTSACLLAASLEGVKIEREDDNLVVRAHVSKLRQDIMKWKDNSGYFLEYNCEDILELKDLCSNQRCQTIAYLGEKDMLVPLLKSGIKGVDRVVPLGKTMDFDLIWDGYNIFERLTRIIAI